MKGYYLDKNLRVAFEMTRVFPRESRPCNEMSRSVDNQGDNGNNKQHRKCPE
jgi:hypothetical protein